MELYCDNTGAIANAKEHGFSKRTMHIKRKYHVIRELIENEDIKMCKVGTESNTTDPLTKSLPLAKHERYVGAMGNMDQYVDYCVIMFQRSLIRGIYLIT
jgi:hypothetical protein